MAEQDLRAAKRYATALFATAQKQGSLDAVSTDLRAILEAMESVPALRQTWESPLMPAGRKRDVISKVLGKSIAPLTLSFLRLLIDKRREGTLTEVLRELAALIDVADHRVRAEAIFATAPTTAETQQLLQSLEQRTGEHVELTVRVDPGLLGGIVVRMQDNIIDGSVRGTLEQLRDQLLQEA